MRPRSLKSRLLLAVAALVIGSGLVIAFLVTHQYSAALRRAMFSQAENLAHSVALDAADKVLLNDLVALQRMLDQQTQSNPVLAYIFVMRDGQVLAHTFERGVPVQLLEANGIGPATISPVLRRSSPSSGETFLDTAWPIYDGKAGMLRSGVFRKPVPAAGGQVVGGDRRLHFGHPAGGLDGEPPVRAPDHPAPGGPGAGHQRNRPGRVQDPGCRPG